MSLAMVSVHHVRPVFPLRKTQFLKLPGACQLIHDGFVTGAALLGTAPIAMPLFQNQINDVSVANQAMKVNKSAGPARQVKVDILWGSVGSLRLHVDQLCAANPAQASAYIAASGFKEAQIPLRQDEVLKAEATNVPGQVLLTMHSYLLATPKNKPTAKRTHLIRHTLDNKKTFINDEATSGSHALIDGLPTLTQIGFEIAAKDSSGVSAYCNTVWIMLTK
jgi:hypothetical protein